MVGCWEGDAAPKPAHPRYTPLPVCTPCTRPMLPRPLPCPLSARGISCDGTAAFSPWCHRVCVASKV